MILRLLIAIVLSYLARYQSWTFSNCKFNDNDDVDVYVNRDEDDVDDDVDDDDSDDDDASDDDVDDDVDEDIDSDNDDGDDNDVDVEVMMMR